MRQAIIWTNGGLLTDEYIRYLAYVIQYSILVTILLDVAKSSAWWDLVKCYGFDDSRFVYRFPFKYTANWAITLFEIQQACRLYP